MEKVKLTQYKIDKLKRIKKELPNEVVIRRFSNRRYYGCLVSPKTHITWESLVDLTLDEMIRALYIGYEVYPEYKAGDWIAYHEASEDKTTVVKIVEVDESNRIWADFEGNNMLTWLGSENVRHATPEEKERRWWKNHGREPWQLSLYDCLIKKDGMTPSPKIVTGIEKDSRNGKTTIFFNTSGWSPKEKVKKDYNVLYFEEDRKDIK